MRIPMIAVASLLAAIGTSHLAAAGSEKDAAKAAQNKQAAVVGAELSTIAKHLQIRPQTAIDFTHVSGEYCFETGLGRGAHMTHYAVDPSSTQEDIIDFVNAQPLIEAGVNVDSLPKFPGGLGTMEPNTWYFLAAGEHEPHHGTEFPMPLLIRATNLE